MKDSRIKILLLSIVSLLVLLILFSNIGQNFKIDISSYDEVLMHYKKMQSYSGKAHNYQSYINYNSNYIRTVMKKNKFEPLNNDNYIDSWIKNTPIVNSQSTLEVFNTANKLIKRYNPKSDFFEDFRGNITSGTVKSKGLYEENFDSINEVLKEILLFDGYKEMKTNEDISQLDTKLKSLGASGMISPLHTNKPLSESGFYLSNLKVTKNSKGIAKFLVTPSVFEELNNYVELGYKIKIKSGAENASITYKNVHGIIKGKNPTFKPLVINVFYDGPYKSGFTKFIGKKNYLLPSTLVLDCIRVINKQRLRRPDRTIVFNFLCGYAKNKEGMLHYQEYLTSNRVNDIIKNGFQIYLDGFGLKDDLNIEYSKASSNLASNINYFANKSNLIVKTKKRNIDLTGSVVHLYMTDINKLKDINIPNTKLITNSTHFLLSVIQDECYNINLLTGNFRQTRVFERSIRNNSAVLSIIAISLLTVVLFAPKGKLKNIINYK